MPNITRGGNARGLMVYLLGPGRANEHVDQHILAGTEDIAGPDFFGGRTLTHDEALRAGRRLDLDRLEHGTEIVSTRTRWDYEAQEMASAGRGPAHVWHCSLTLHPDEGALSDETWAKIAEDFVDEMGFTAASGKAACRWVAVRHGVNAGGGDHIHIAVNLVREDGTKASVWRDWPRAQAACNTLEHRYGLAVVESREHQRGSRGDSPAEQAAARRDGQALTDRARLEIALRAAASGARTESEFLLALRGEGVLVRPRYAKGTREHVDGFSVAVRPPEGARPNWIGAYYVARDLSLRRLRTGWADVSGERRKALALWAPQRRTPGRPWVSREEWDARQKEMWKAMAAAVDESLARLDAVPVGDDESLAACARDAAGVFASLSARYDGRHPNSFALAGAARSIGRLAQRKPPPVRRTRPPSQARAAFAHACLRTGGSGRFDEDERVWQAAARLVQALAATLAVHGQTVTARRVRADAEKALAILQPRPVAQRLVEVTFPDRQTPSSTRPRTDDGKAPARPRAGLSEAEVAQALLAATFDPMPSVSSPPTATTPDEALPRRPRRRPGPRQEPPRQR
mgnify:CR=1 FL=1